MIMKPIEWERKGAKIVICESIYREHSFFVKMYFPKRKIDFSYEVPCANEEKRKVDIEREIEKLNFLVDTLDNLDWKVKGESENE